MIRLRTSLVLCVARFLNAGFCLQVTTTIFLSPTSSLK